MRARHLQHRGRVRPWFGLLILLAGVAAGAQVAAPLPASTRTIEGRVYDSLSFAPLADAVVQLTTPPGVEPRVLLSARTDDEGRFSIERAPLGSYLATFSHPLLDLLGLEPFVRNFVLAPRGRAQLALSTPSSSRLARALCPRGAADDSAGLFLGHIRDARSARPVPGASLLLRWAEVTIADGHVMMDEPSIATQTNSQGWFAVCNLPVGVDISARVASGSDTSGIVRMKIPWRSVAHREFYVGPVQPEPGTGIASASGEITVEKLWRGPGRLRGRVTTYSGSALAGAHIRVWGTKALATTSERGTFNFGDLPSGTQTVEVRALGYLPHREVVDLVAEGEQDSLEVTMTNTKDFLDTVRVVARRNFAEAFKGFDIRRKSASGHFITREEFTIHPKMYVTDALTGMAGVDVQLGSAGQSVIMRGTTGARCLPSVYIDNVRIASTADGFVESSVDLFVNPSDLEGMEVYAHPLQVPVQYANGTCGAIVIWTNRIRLPSAKSKP